MTLSELPLKRGSLALAIRLIAAKHGMTEDSVKKALKRSGGINQSWSNIRRLFFYKTLKLSAERAAFRPQS